MAASLEELYQECETKFAALKPFLTDQDQEDKAFNSRIIDQYDRFQIWAGNIGARQSSGVKTSLDWRLREATKLKHQIGELLEDLASATEEITSIASGERPNRTSSPISTPDGSDSEDHGLSELDELIEMVSETIAGLFKISLLIQRATPRDRFVKAQSSIKEPFDSLWDISHVSEKFSKLLSKDQEWLRRKFGLANVQRRQYFRYARQHREKKAKPSETIVPTSLDIPEQSKPLPLTIEVGVPETRTILSSQKPASSFAQTTASTLAVAKLQAAEQESEDDAASHTSFATSVNESNNPDRLRVPKLQDVSQGQQEFECPYCFMIVKPRSHNQWKKHVYEDLRPYICTFKGCDIKLFSDRRSWFEHEIQTHRIAFQCRFCSRRAFNTENELEKHLSVKHQQLYQPSTVAAIIKASEEPQDSFDASLCPCCTEWESELRQLNSHIPLEDAVHVTGKQFRNHLANHQEQVALFALPKHYEDDDGDVESAGVAAGDSSSNLSELSQLSVASSQGRLEDKTQKLFQKLEALLAHKESSDNYTLHSVVNQLLRDRDNLNRVFQVVLPSPHPQSEEMVELALENDADPNQLINGETALSIACWRKNLNLLKILVKAGSDVSASGQSKSTAVNHAVRESWLEGHKFLMDCGVDINQPSAENGERPIHTAARYCQGPFLRYLVQSGANPRQVNYDDETPLHIAIKNSNILAATELLLLGVPRDPKDAMGRTPLHNAVRAANVEGVKFLTSHNADPNTVDYMTNCPLVSAVERHVQDAGESKAIVQLLLSSNASIQVWRSQVDDTHLRLLIQSLRHLEQIFQELGVPATTTVEDYIQEALAAETRATHAGRGHVVATKVQRERDESEGSFPRPDADYWRGMESSQLELLAERKREYGLTGQKFLASLDMLAALYQDWGLSILSYKSGGESTQIAELEKEVSWKLRQTCVDLWMNDQRYRAQEVMKAVLNLASAQSPTQYTILNSIAAAIKLDDVENPLWRPKTDESDWKRIIEHRDASTATPFIIGPGTCELCPELGSMNDQILSIHKSWHSIPLAGPERPENDPSGPSDVVSDEFDVESSFYSGPMIYGVLKYDFKAERPDELTAQSGETVMFLARTHEGWFVAKLINTPSKSGLIPLEYVEILYMSFGRPVSDVEAAIKAAHVPTVEQWREFNNLLEGRSRVMLSQTNAPIPAICTILGMKISNNHDLYHVQCQSRDGTLWQMSRFYMEFYEFQTALMRNFPDEARDVDGPQQRILPYLQGPALFDGRQESLDRYLTSLFALPSYISQCQLIGQFFAPSTETLQHEVVDTNKENIVQSDTAEEVANQEITAPTAAGHQQNAEPRSAQSNDDDELSVSNIPQDLPNLERQTSGSMNMAFGLLCDILVTGCPRYGIKLRSKMRRRFAKWLVHAYGLGIGDNYPFLIAALLNKIGSLSSPKLGELVAWISRKVCQTLDMRQLEGATAYKCFHCNKRNASLQPKHTQSGIIDDAPVRLCVSCVVKLHFLDDPTDCKSDITGDRLGPATLELGYLLIQSNPLRSDGEMLDSEALFQRQRSLVDFGLDFLKLAGKTYALEVRIATRIGELILMKPHSYLLTDQEFEIFQDHSWSLGTNADEEIAQDARRRYHEHKSSQHQAKDQVMDPPMQPEKMEQTSFSFLFAVMEVQPNYDVKSRQTWKKRWLPPDTRDGIKPTIEELAHGNVYRWMDGNVMRVSNLDLANRKMSSSLDTPHTFSTYTVIMDESKAFACVPFDARRLDVRSSDVGEWQYLGFDHVYDQKRLTVFSEVVAPGEFARLAGYKEDTSPFIRDLFPGEFRSAIPKASDKTPVVHRGLIGRLPLIIALAAFSAPAHDLDETLTKGFRQGRDWQSINEVSHARMRRRGVVVTVWEDVSVDNRMAKSALIALEKGQYGPILHCDWILDRGSGKKLALPSTKRTSTLDSQRKTAVDSDAIIGKDSSDRFSRSGISKERMTVTTSNTSETFRNARDRFERNTTQRPKASDSFEEWDDNLFTKPSNAQSLLSSSQTQRGILDEPLKIEPQTALSTDRGKQEDRMTSGVTPQRDSTERSSATRFTATPSDRAENNEDDGSFEPVFPRLRSKVREDKKRELASEIRTAGQMSLGPSKSSAQDSSILGQVSSWFNRGVGSSITDDSQMRPSAEVYDEEKEDEPGSQVKGSIDQTPLLLEVDQNDEVPAKSEVLDKETERASGAGWFSSSSAKGTYRLSERIRSRAASDDYER